jgi:hypothetical protein
MDDYEIRILNSQHKTAALIAMLEPSDDFAIRSAERIANGRPVEVWRDLDCIYRNGPKTDGLRHAA